MAKSNVDMRYRISVLAVTFVLLFTMTLPFVAPLLRGSADAASGVSMAFGNPSGSPYVNKVQWLNYSQYPSQSWAQGVICQPTYRTGVLTDDMIYKALGPDFYNMSQWRGQSQAMIEQHFFPPYPGGSQPQYASSMAGFGDVGGAQNGGTIDQKVGMNYINYLLSHIDKTVNYIAFYNAPGSGNKVCGASFNKSSDYTSAQFVLVPTEGPDALPDTFIGRQILVQDPNAPQCSSQSCPYQQAGLGGVLRVTHPTLNISNDVVSANLDYYDSNGKYHQNSPQTIQGVPLPTTPKVVGNATSANFQDVAHINLTYRLNGNDYKETYTDFEWDSNYYYFLTSTNEPARANLTFNNSGEDPGIDPTAADTTNKVPFIKANFCTSGSFASGFNVSYNNNGGSPLTDAQVIQRIQAGITCIGRGSPAGLQFYDFDFNGSPINPQKNSNVPTPENIDPGDILNSNIWFYSDGQSNFATAFTSGAGNEAYYVGNYALNGNTNNPTFYDHSAGDCNYLGRVQTTSGAPVKGMTGTIAVDWTLFRNGRSCQPANPPGMGTLHVQALIDPTLYGDASTNAGPTNNNSASNQQMVCDIAKFSLSWFVCPLVQGAISLTSALDSGINSMLNFNVDTFMNESDKNNAGYYFYQVWNSFRSLALAIIVIAALVMIISQAFGFDVLDAYTVKKVMPRLLLAVIFISLSWALMKVAITASDLAGYSVRALIYAPFNQGSAAHIGAGTSDALGILGGAYLISLGPLGMLALAGTALMAVFVGFVLLVVRQMVIMFMVVLAPLAIALSILPNTRKGWKMWSDTTMGVLIVFPIIAAFIAAGHAFAKFSSHMNVGGVIGQFIFLIAYFAPYFMIPMAFRMAGGLMSTLTGMVNDRSKGVFDRLRNARSNQQKARGQRWQQGTLWNPDSRATRWLGGNMINALGGRTGAFMQYGNFANLVGKRGAAMRANLRTAKAAEYAHEDKHFAANMDNEAVMAAHVLNNNRELLGRMKYFQNPDGTVNEDLMSSSIAASETIQRTGRSVYAAMDALGRSGKVITTREDMNNMLDVASGGNRELRGAMKGGFQFLARGSGNNAVGRNSNFEALKEMSSGEWAQLKPWAAESLIESIPELLRSGQSMTAAEQAEAISRGETPRVQTLSDTEKQHLVDLLYSNQYGPYSKVYQQSSIQNAITQLRSTASGQAAWDMATTHYREKLTSGSTGSPGTAGTPPPGAVIPVPPPAPTGPTAPPPAGPRRHGPII